MELVLSLGIIAVFRRLSNVSHLMASLLKRDFDISKHFFIIAKKNSIIDTPLRVVQNNNSLSTYIKIMLACRTSAPQTHYYFMANECI